MPIRAVQDGCSAVSASARTHSRISSSVSTEGPGRDLAVVVRRERRLVEDVARHPDRLHPLLAVGGRRQVVEQHRRVLPRVPRLDPHVAAGVGVHRADVDLVAVALDGRGAVVPDGDRAGSGTSGSGSRRRRCCARSRRPRSGWWRRAPCAGRATGRRSSAAGARPGRARWTPAACWRTGCRPRGGPGGSPPPRAGGGPPGSRAASSSASSPTPESWSSCGVLIAPPQRITSPASTAWWRRGPLVVDADRALALEPDSRSRRRSVRTVRFFRLRTGCR